MPDAEVKVREALAEYLQDPTKVGLDTELVILATRSQRLACV